MDNVIEGKYRLNQKQILLAKIQSVLYTGVPILLYIYHYKIEEQKLIHEVTKNNSAKNLHLHLHSKALTFNPHSVLQCVNEMEYVNAITHRQDPCCNQTV